MSHAQTKREINELLSVIGSNGLDGIRIEAKSRHDALQDIICTNQLQTIRTPKQLLSELGRQDLIETEVSAPNIIFRLTVKGVHRLQLSQVRRHTIPTPQTWDGKLRMIAFDIPTRHGESRYLLTSQLKQLGFVIIKRSVWLHPYPCFDIIQPLIVHANIQNFVTFAEISNIDSASFRQIKAAYPNL